METGRFGERERERERDWLLGRGVSGPELQDGARDGAQDSRPS